MQTIDQWYSLSLPFAVSSVKVWDDEDGAYYDIVPYYRTGGKFYTGHYIIRRPETVTNYAIETFEENWVDPDNSGVLPEKNIPYIIQWHSSYFQDKYVSFFGGTGQIIPGAMTVGDAPSTNTVVNVYGNNSMTTGSVPGAYMLEPDYGEGGAWLRGETAIENRTINPFECYIRASGTVTAQFQVIRRGMKIEETATGWQDVLNSETKSYIAVYTLSGVLMAKYENCSFAEVARHLRTEQHNGLFILRAENESVKLMIGGK